MTLETCDEVREILAKLLKKKCEDALKYHNSRHLFHLVATPETTLRNTKKIILTVGGFVAKSKNDRSCRTVQMLELNQLHNLKSKIVPHPESSSYKAYDEARDLYFDNRKRWSFPTGLCENGVCVLDNVLYVAGGQTQYSEDGQFTSDKVFRFDPRFQEWEEVGYVVLDIYLAKKSEMNN